MSEHELDELERLERRARGFEVEAAQLRREVAHLRDVVTVVQAERRELERLLLLEGICPGCGANPERGGCLGPKPCCPDCRHEPYDTARQKETT